MPALVPPVVPSGRISGQRQPSFAVDELLVRPWEAGDAPAVERAYADPEIQHWHGRSMTADEAVSWLLSWAPRWSDETAAGWAVVDPGGLVGRVSFRAVDPRNGSAEAGYWVLPEARGRRVAARALTATCDWLLGEVGLHRIWLVHSVANPASCRVAARAGFVGEGTEREQALHADGWHDMHRHARLAGDPGRLIG
jgi:RimJ/RimL family protein N-acetyltransferase